VKITYEALTVEDENPTTAHEEFRKLLKVLYPEYIKRPVD